MNDIYALKISALWKAFRKEHISYWFLIVYFSFEYVRPQTLYPVIDILPWAQIFLTGSIVMVFSNKSAKWVSNLMNKLFILFFIITVLSGVFSFYPEYSWKFRSVMLSWIIVYFLVISIVNTEKRLIIFFLAYLLFSLKMGQHGFFSWATRGFSFASFGLIGSPGWFRNSGEYAIQMLIFGSLGLSLVLSLGQYWSKVKKIILYFAAATGYLTIVGASSRGSQLGLAVIVIWYSVKSKNGMKGLMIVSSISLLLYSILPAEQLERFSTMGEDVNSVQRLVYWDIGWQLIKDFPMGIGYYNWLPYVYSLYPEGVGPLNIVQVCHSIYIEAAVELGILGFVIYIWMIIYAFIINSRTRKLAEQYEDRLFVNLSYGLDAGLIGFLVAGAFVTVLYYPFFWIQIAFIVALNNVCKVKQNEKLKILNTE